jgi:uncharacterized protein
MPSGLSFELVEHRYFQRLRRIKQLGLTYYVYPGALHTRFQHALGAYHLMSLAIDVLRQKGIEITSEEEEAVSIAILLHDIGHGPFSHALENSIVDGIDHEKLSLMFMRELNSVFNNRLNMAIEIFQNRYEKKFLHHLVSGQLDVDRLDYLSRDSFFSGVIEGNVSSDRIIKMMNITDDKLVIESKGIYSIENFIIARRLMYWQVYLHKTVLAAEQLMVKILKRAKFLALNGDHLFGSPSLLYFLSRFNNSENMEEDTSRTVLKHFSELDDYDLISAFKVWMNHSDKVLSLLCQALINRNLYKIRLQKQPFEETELLIVKNELAKRLNLSFDDTEYFAFSGEITNNAYSTVDDRINIMYNNGNLIDIADASDMLNVSVLSKMVKKNYICIYKA